MLTPEFLKKGDCVAIISPATKVKDEYVDGAAEFLRRRGYVPLVLPGAKGPACGSFASSLPRRVADLRFALSEPEVKAILCARGGYGCVHLLSEIAVEEVACHPKWIIGFSDVSALHALWQIAGVESVHAPMAKHITLEGDSDFCTTRLFEILEGRAGMDYEVPRHPFNRFGCARGVLRGGNLAVLNGLSGTRFDILHVAPGEKVVLFIEDVSEAVYAVERMLTRLALSGDLGRVAGLIVGRFTEYGPDLNHSSMEEMISRLLSRYGIDGIPVAFNFPVGHVSRNLPLVEGRWVELCVTPEGSTLRECSPVGVKPDYSEWD